jgi:hypothetical protein
MTTRTRKISTVRSFVGRRMGLRKECMWASLSRKETTTRSRLLFRRQYKYSIIALHILRHSCSAGWHLLSAVYPFLDNLFAVEKSLPSLISILATTEQRLAGRDAVIVEPKH